MSLSRASLGKDRRILKSGEFAAILKAGGRGATSMVSAAAIPVSGPGRIGISVPVKVGGSVQRNRARRHVREHYRQTYRRGALPYDIVFNLKPGFAELSAAEAGRAIDEALARAIGARKRGARRPHPVH